MDKQHLINEIKSSREFFERSTRVLTEEDSVFCPVKGTMTTAHQVMHTALTIEWFLNGAFSNTGFDMNFEAHAAECSKVNSLSEARRRVQSAYEKAIKKLEESSESDLSAAIVQNPIMAGEPRYSAFLGIIEHTAHHRGALTVYSRLLGKTPAMPYMDL